MIKNILTLALTGTVFFSCNFTEQNKNQAKEQQPIKTETVQKKPYTSVHIFTAIFEGITFHNCMGRTSSCPEKCGESGNLANFKVKAYKDFIVNGEAGTVKLSEYSILISDYYKKDLKKPFVNEIKNLKKGDEVVIHLEYIYDTSKSAVQTVENLVKITKTSSQAIPYTIAKNYFVKNIYKDLIKHDTKDNSELQIFQFSFQRDFEKLFGMATTMGNDGKPTIIDFTKSYVIACVADESDITNSIEIISLNKSEKKIEFTCKRVIGEKKSSTSQQSVLLIVDKKYLGDIILHEIK